MAAPRILPLGFIDRTTDDGAIILLTTPSNSHNLRSETPVTLRRRSTGTPSATARVRGLITSVGYVTATFRVVETQTDPNWPEGEQILRRDTPVYQALPGSFTFDPGRALTKEHAEALSRLGARYRDITRPKPPEDEGPRQPPTNGASPKQQRQTE